MKAASVLIVLLLLGLYLGLSTSVEHENVEPNREEQNANSDSTTQSKPISLTAPLTTIIYADKPFDVDANSIRFACEIPKNVPKDLGLGVFLADDDGNWFMRMVSDDLVPGRNNIEIPIDVNDHWQSTPEHYEWNNYHLQLVRKFGVYFWSQEHNNTSINIYNISCVNKTVQKEQDALHIVNLQLQNVNESGKAHGFCGERWEMHFQLNKLPKNPYSTAQLQSDLHVQSQHGQFTIPGFFKEPQELVDGGDSERSIPNGPNVICHRFRPRQAGQYQLSLEVNCESETINVTLPDLIVTGDDWDDYVRNSQKDSRFFSIGKNNDTFYWPVGINLRSVNDALSKSALKTIYTPARGSLSYAAYFNRLERAGVNAIEIWMSSWNLAFEWIDDWPGYHGINGYHAAHTQQLDAILDAAYQHNIRVILSFRNHGQACTIRILQGNWHLNPMNTKNGGFISDAKQYFTHEQALRLQKDYHRYLCARYADHPSIMFWKLWSEVDLTAEGFPDYHQRRRSNATIRDWHADMSKHLQDLDIYDHPVATHWSTDYKLADPEIIKLATMDVGCLDAYHWDSLFRKSYLYNKLTNSMIHPRQGLNHLMKPIVVTEFGGSPFAAKPKKLLAEHRSGPWIGLVSGHGMSPFLWWYEWVDQNNYWQPYRAVQAFIQGEDLRGDKSRTVALSNSSETEVWTRAWVKPGCLLGYCLDKQWSHSGGNGKLHGNLQITFGEQIRAGSFSIEWWDASQGLIIKKHTLKHDGGRLTISAPDFRKHLALKCKRL